MKFPPGQFGLIYADPAWQYTMYSDKGYEKSPDAHYTCMTIDELQNLRDSIMWAAAPDCVMFMWAVWPMMPQAIDLLKHYGFTYKTGGDWNKITVHGKQSFGTGYIFRTATEPFIIGTRGQPKIKNRRTRNCLFTGEVPEDLSQLGITISSLRREHSRKPDEMADLLMELFEGRYLEMFARTRRPGWEVAGNETEKFT